MKLSIIDRLALPRATAKIKGSFVELILAESIEDSVKITKDDLELYKIETTESGGIKWDEKADTENPLDLEFEDKEIELIRNGFQEIEKAGEATRDLLSAYKKFKDLETMEIEIVEK